MLRSALKIHSDKRSMTERTYNHGDKFCTALMSVLSEFTVFKGLLENNVPGSKIDMSHSRDHCCVGGEEIMETGNHRLETLFSTLFSLISGTT